MQELECIFWITLRITPLLYFLILSLELIDYLTAAES